MAGKPVFRMAKRFPSFLGFVAELQCLGFRIAHDFVLVRLFAKSNPNERRLVSEHEVRKALHAGLHNSMANYPTANVQAIIAYVGDWSGLANGHLPCCNLAWQGGQFGANCDV